MRNGRRMKRIRDELTDPTIGRIMPRKTNPFAWSPGPMPQVDWSAWTRKQLGKRERLACEVCGGASSDSTLCGKCHAVIHLCCNEPIILRRLANYLEHRDGLREGHQGPQGPA